MCIQLLYKRHIQIRQLLKSIMTHVLGMTQTPAAKSGCGNKYKRQRSRSAMDNYDCKQSCLSAADDSTGGGRVAAYAWYNSKVPTGTITIGGSGTQNFWRANNSSCKLADCNSTYDAQSDISVAQLGTNTYTNPSFTNTTDLLANRTWVPNCNVFRQHDGVHGMERQHEHSDDAEHHQRSWFRPRAARQERDTNSPRRNARRMRTIRPGSRVSSISNGTDRAFTENSDLVTKPCNM